MDQDPSLSAVAPATQTAQATQQAAPAQTSDTANIHFFDKRNYDEAIAVLVEFCGYVLLEGQKAEPLTREKLGNMLNIYAVNCMRQGPSPDVKVPEGATCQHQFSKGERANQFCGAKANNVGAADGLPKCSAHKNSKLLRQLPLEQLHLERLDRTSLMLPVQVEAKLLLRLSRPSKHRSLNRQLQHSFDLPRLPMGESTIPSPRFFSSRDKRELTLFGSLTESWKEKDLGV
jgi:hypothetical protein